MFEHPAHASSDGGPIMTPPLDQNCTRAAWLIAAITEHSSDECLLWPFAVDEDGYGRVPYRIDGKQTRVGAHRLAFKFIYGRWPEPNALHACDTPGCFNPRHIYEGTILQNQRDMAERGRSVRGTKQRDAKLTDELVAAMRNEYATGTLGYAALAAKYNISRVGAKSAITGKTWKHVPGAVGAKRTRKEPQAFCKRGHLLNDDTCYVYKNGRNCKQCKALQSANRVRR